ncbi:hypothetical protein [Streptomyces prunicolor]
MYHKSDNHRWAPVIASLMAVSGIIFRVWDQLLTAVLPRLPFGDASMRKYNQQQGVWRTGSPTPPRSIGEVHS